MASCSGVRDDVIGFIVAWASFVGLRFTKGWAWGGEGEEEEEEEEEDCMRVFCRDSDFNELWTWDGNGTGFATCGNWD